MRQAGSRQRKENRSRPFDGDSVLRQDSWRGAPDPPNGRRGVLLGQGDTQAEARSVTGRRPTLTLRWHQYQLADSYLSPALDDVGYDTWTQNGPY